MSTPFNVYDIGDLVHMNVAFTNDANVATDPTTVVFKLRRESDTVVVYTYGTDTELVRDSTGAYHVDYTTTLSGNYAYRFVGTGAVQASEEWKFRVRYSRTEEQ